MTPKKAAQIKSILVFGISLLTISSRADEKPAEAYPSLTRHGQTHQSACEGTARQTLSRHILYSGLPKPKQLWRTVQLILCDRANQRNQEMITALVAKKIRRSSDSIDSESSVAVLNRSALLPDMILASGNAWRAHVKVDDQRLEVHYYSNEACIETRTFQYTDRWRLTEIGRGCD